jgi:hypothetical protein
MRIELPPPPPPPPPPPQSEAPHSPIRSAITLLKCRQANVGSRSGINWGEDGGGTSKSDTHERGRTYGRLRKKKKKKGGGGRNEKKRKIETKKRTEIQFEQFDTTRVPVLQNRGVKT